MAARIFGFGRVLVAMATCAAFARAGMVSAQDARSRAQLALERDEPEAPSRVVIEGFVLALDGAPAEGAVVVSSAGGRAITDAAGTYRLEVEVPPGATHVQVTAVGSSGAVASMSVAVSASTPSARVRPLALTRGSHCSPSWLPTFGAEPGTDSSVYALAVYDDGGGPALYVGGDFRSAGGVWAVGIAKWDGSSWSPLGSGSALDADSKDYVVDLAVFDDGGGSALYVAGSFSHANDVPADGIAKWDGSSWSTLDGGADDQFVGALAVYDDGSGPALYAGGSFEDAGGVPANGIAKWDGTSWSALGSGMNGYVAALTTHDDGGGPALFAGGGFTTAGGGSANRIAKWNGSSWAALGSGLDGQVYALLSHVEDGGPALYVGGVFTSAGGASANRIAMWDGGSWSEPGDGLMDSSGFPSSVQALRVYDDGSGEMLYAGGAFWLPASNLAKLDGSSWAQIGSGVSSSVTALAVHDDGGGQALYAGGYFASAGGVPANRIAKWDGSSWAPLGSGMDGIYSLTGAPSVQALAVFDDGGGPTLHAGGQFATAGGVAASRIAKWNGSSWSALGSGVNNDVLALAVHDDGGGPALFAGGLFTVAGGGTANRIARWNGTSWSALGTGTNNAVRALVVFDDGGGPALYAGGSFGSAGGVAASGIAKWNGTSWSALGNLNGWVEALAVFDDGSGPALYAGGSFSTAGGTAANRIARWDGASWSALGQGVNANSSVLALAAHDDGGGPALYAGGTFSSAGGGAASCVAKWDGSSWSALGSGLGDMVHALAVHDDGSGPALFVGGYFMSALDSGDSFLAKWGCDSVPPVLACPASVLTIDGFNGPPGEVVHYTVTASDESDPSPVVVCVPPSGSFFPQGTTLVNCTATDATGNQSSCQFPVTVAPRIRQRHP